MSLTKMAQGRRAACCCLSEECLLSGGGEAEEQGAKSHIRLRKGPTATPQNRRWSRSQFLCCTLPAKSPSGEQH